MPIRGASKRSGSVDISDLVKTSFLEAAPAGPPLVLQPSTGGVDLVGWLGIHQPEIQDHLSRYGALLFRGFDIRDGAAFEKMAAAAAGSDLYGDYGDLPRESAGDKIFSSTPYPDNLIIHFHNESSHMSQWPMRIFFYSAIVAETGGATPILDCRALCDTLDQSVVDELDCKELLYIRNFSESVDVPWQQFFGTSDRAEVERVCHMSRTSCEWLPDGTLRTRQPAKAVRRHPITGDRVFFNQVLLHHPAALPDEFRQALIALWGSPDALPRNVTFGDGTPIPDSTVKYLEAEFDRQSVSFPWEVNDVLMLDNMLVSHSRSTFTGQRKIIVAMSGIVSAED